MDPQDHQPVTTSSRVSSSSQIDYALLQQHFHLPISEVAKELGVCATVLKKLCRKHGIPRWPHRKIKSLNKLIAALEETKTETEEEEQQRLSELRSLQKKKQEIIDNPAIIGPTYSRVAPKVDGRPFNNTGKFSNRVAISSPENSLREKSVMAILQRQRKYSAPAVHLAGVPQWAKNFNEQQSRLYTRRSSNGSIRTMPKTPPSSQWQKETSPPQMPSYNRSAPRASCPAVLEGLTPEQIHTLQSMGEPSYPPSPYTRSTPNDPGNWSPPENDSPHGGMPQQLPRPPLHHPEKQFHPSEYSDGYPGPDSLFQQSQHHFRYGSNNNGGGGYPPMSMYSPNDSNYHNPPQPQHPPHVYSIYHDQEPLSQFIPHPSSNMNTSPTSNTPNYHPQGGSNLNYSGNSGDFQSGGPNLHGGRPLTSSFPF
mmetsp:Transcript_38331/g.82413  ORF Transcript_38331/g.82413 Transcript_38331/m.82413 type:complete len:423 (+) Transcript_38331:51-1319(+)